MTLDIWTAAVLILGVGIAATGLVEAVKAVVRGLWVDPDKQHRLETPAYVLLSLATCLGLTGWAASPIGVPLSWAIIAGLVASACSAIVYKWFLGSFLRRGLPALTRGALARIETADTVEPTPARTHTPE